MTKYLFILIIIAFTKLHGGVFDFDGNVVTITNHQGDLLPTQLGSKYYDITSYFEKHGYVYMPVDDADVMYKTVGSYSEEIEPLSVDDEKGYNRVNGYRYSYGYFYNESPKLEKIAKKYFDSIYVFHKDELTRRYGKPKKKKDYLIFTARTDSTRYFEIILGKYRHRIGVILKFTVDLKKYGY